MTDYMNAADRIRTLNTVPEEQRDDDWYVDMLDAIPEASYVLSSPDPVRAPDGFYYFNLSLLEPGHKGPLVKLDKKLLDDCLDRVAGIVIYPGSADGENPVWILSYGELHSFRNFENFSGDPADLEEMFRAETTSPVTGGEVLLAAPSADFIHPGARKFLKSFFDALGFEDVEIALMTDLSQAPSRILVLSLQEEDFEDQAVLDDLLNALSWLLPPNRSVMLDPGLEAGDFTPLVP